jgi:hypothetical protein
MVCAHRFYDLEKQFQLTYMFVPSSTVFNLGHHVFWVLCAGTVLS